MKRARTKEEIQKEYQEEVDAYERAKASLDQAIGIEAQTPEQKAQSRAVIHEEAAIFLAIMVELLCPKNKEQIVKLIVDDLVPDGVSAKGITAAEAWRKDGGSIHAFPRTGNSILISVHPDGSAMMIKGP